MYSLFELQPNQRLKVLWKVGSLCITFIISVHKSCNINKRPSGPSCFNVRLRKQKSDVLHLFSSAIRRNILSPEPNIISCKISTCRDYDSYLFPAKFKNMTGIFNKLHISYVLLFMLFHSDVLRFSVAAQGKRLTAAR